MKKITLIEDEAILRDLLEKKLKKNGYSVEVAVDGEEGLRKVKEDPPDLILLDIVMPKMDGFELMENIVNIQALKEVPVIVVSNSGQPVDIDRAQELGAVDWIVKTEFDPQEVVDMVEKQIGKGDLSGVEEAIE
ncbi:MAG: response regulator [Patescibacteria group bacterium]